MSTTVLGHVESLNNSRAQSAIPRYRKRGPVKEYVFAAKLKKACSPDKYPREGWCACATHPSAVLSTALQSTADQDAVCAISMKLNSFSCTARDPSQ